VRLERCEHFIHAVLVMIDVNAIQRIDPGPVSEMMMPASKVLPIQRAPIELGRQNSESVKIRSVDYLIQNSLVIEGTSIMSASAGSDFVAYFGAGWQVPESDTCVQVRTGETLTKDSHWGYPLSRSSDAPPSQKVIERGEWLNANGIGTIDDEHVLRIELIGKSPAAKEGISPDGGEGGIVLDQMVLKLGMPILRELLVVDENVQLSFRDF